MVRFFEETWFIWWLIAVAAILLWFEIPSASDTHINSEDSWLDEEDEWTADDSSAGVRNRPEASGLAE